MSATSSTKQNRVPGAADGVAEHARQAIVGDAAGAAGEIAAFADDDNDELRECERRQRQIKAFEPRRRERDDERQQGAQRHGEHEGDAERQPELVREDDDRVGADAGEGEVRERDLSRDAEQEIVAQRERDPDQHLAIDVGGVAAEPERQCGRGDDRG